MTLANRDSLEHIDAGRRAAGWVHSNWYWHQVSLKRADVDFRLVYVGDETEAVGMVGYGQAYADEALLQPVPGRYELAHLVIDHRHHGRGIGRATARTVLTMLAAQPDCQEVVVAHHPDNAPSRTLFIRLGLHTTDERNYDGDPFLRGTPTTIRESQRQRGPAG